MNQIEIFDSLARNAFDFLERGISEFDKDPKYSVIHFCAAVEMLLKARLMKEHWSLIVSKPEQADHARFVAGDFISVTMDEARVRIRDIAGEDISNDALSSFRALATHRNKMIHFFHAGLEADAKAKAGIVAEHCRSWVHLHQLLTRWDYYFEDFHADIASADRSMKKHRKYLRTKFSTLKPELMALGKTGKTPLACSSCGFKAAIPESIDSQLSMTRCLVCDHNAVQVEIECPHCNEEIVIENEGYASCPECSGQIEPEDIVNALTDDVAAHNAIRDGDDSYLPGNCSSCDGYHTVVYCGDKYFCASCFEISDSVEHCGWCHEPNTGDMENSYSVGCNHCDGWVGHQKDD